MTRIDPATGEVKGEFAVRYRCNSWRHDGDCRRYIAAQNFARVKAALMPLRPRDVVYVVLTLDPNRTRPRGSSSTAQETWTEKSRYVAFKRLLAKWRSLRKAITRTYGANRYVATVEVHRSGWPHLNVVMHAPGLARYVAQPNRGAAFEWLKRHAVKCGFGWRCSLERARDKRALAGYVVKIAGEVEQAARADATGRLVGEVVKLSQVPEDAPAHFRRLRASIRFLPPPLKGTHPEITGELVKQPPPDNAIDPRRKRRRR